MDVIVAWKRVVTLEVTNQVFNIMTSNPFLSVLECQDWARLYVTYQGLFGEFFFLLLCPGVEVGGFCIYGWVEGLKVKLSLALGI